MNCIICGATFERITTDLPFKTGNHSIVIIKDLPVFQCSSCSEFMIEDAVMAAVDRTISQASSTMEIEVLHYAA